MPTVKPFDYVSVENYLEGEKVASVKHEYVYGQIYAMAGASKRHNLVAGNIFVNLQRVALQKNYAAYISDMKVRIAEDIFYYPDVMVVPDFPTPLLRIFEINSRIIRTKQS